jgi:hypothetical protein
MDSQRHNAREERGDAGCAVWERGVSDEKKERQAREPELALVDHREMLDQAERRASDEPQRNTTSMTRQPFAEMIFEGPRTVRRSRTRWSCCAMSWRGPSLRR